MKNFTSGHSLMGNERVLAFIADLPHTDAQDALCEGVPSNVALHLHLEIYTRVWSTLASALPEDCRTTVYGHAALQHPATGLLLAAASEHITSYAYSLKSGQERRARPAAYSLAVMLRSSI